jgi:hypothetical protein
VTVDWGSTPQWIGIYVGGVIAVYLGTRYEMSVIRSAGDRFQDAFAEKVRALQHFALEEITKGFGSDYPTLRKLIETPPKAPQGDQEEDELRKTFDRAADEVEGIGSKLTAVKHPDDLFTRAREGFETKATLLHQTVISVIFLSLVIPVLLLVEVVGTNAQLSATALVLFDLGLLPATVAVIRGVPCWNLSVQLDKDKKELESEVNEKVNRIRKVGSGGETPPKAPA